MSERLKGLLSEAAWVLDMLDHYKASIEDSPFPSQYKIFAALSPIKLMYYLLYKALCEAKGINSEVIGSLGWYFAYIKTYIPDMSDVLVKAFDTFIEFGLNAETSCTLPVNVKNVRTSVLVNVIDAGHTIYEYIQSLCE